MDKPLYQPFNNPHPGYPAVMAIVGAKLNDRARSDPTFQADHHRYLGYAISLIYDTAIKIGFDQEDATQAVHHYASLQMAAYSRDLTSCEKPNSVNQSAFYGQRAYARIEAIREILMDGIWASIASRPQTPRLRSEFRIKPTLLSTWCSADSLGRRLACTALGAGAKPGYAGESELIPAIFAGDRHLIKALLEAGANPNGTTHDVPQIKRLDQVPLEYTWLCRPSARSAQEEIRQTLLRSGADINILTGNDTLLNERVALGDVQGAQWLVDRGAHLTQWTHPKTRTQVSTSDLVKSGLESAVSDVDRQRFTELAQIIQRAPCKTVHPTEPSPMRM